MSPWLLDNFLPIQPRGDFGIFLISWGGEAGCGIKRARSREKEKGKEVVIGGYGYQNHKTLEF